MNAHAVSFTEFRCPVCDGHDFVPMFGYAVAQQERPRPEKYQITHSSRVLVDAIQRCRTCGLGMLPPDLAETAHYAEGADERFEQQAEIRIRNAERLLGLLPPPDAGAKLLDVGSAYGFLLAAAARLGYQSIGVEPSREAAEYARRTFHVEVFNGPVEAAPLPPASFHVITLADVIEHLRDPAAVLTRLTRLLRPGGRIVILTPDLDSVMARIAGRHWWGLLDDHVLYFSRRTLPRFLERHGLVAERVQSLGRVFPLSHWVFKLSQYSDGLHRVLDRSLRVLGLSQLEIYLNLADQMVCVARLAHGGEGPQ